ncbi:MAG: DUF2723 domain-containing protein [Chloroflexota bacterium]
MKSRERAAWLSRAAPAPAIFSALLALAVTRALLITFPLQFNWLGRWPLVLIGSVAVNPLRDWMLIIGAMGAVITIKTPKVFRTFGVYALAAVVALLYLRTLGPTVGEADTFEFQVNAIRLGISHGSGYPLYLIAAKLFSLLPIGGTAAFRVNLSSAAFGVTAALMVFAVARALGARRAASWIAALSFATSIGFWSRAVEAEVYTLHVTLVGVILLIVLWKLEVGRPKDGRLEVGGWKLEVGGWRLDYLLAFVFGLSLTNHLTTILLAPAVLIAFGISLIAYRLSPSAISHHPSASRLGIWIFGFGICFLLGLSLYLYLPLRWPAVNNGEAMTWELFRHFITGQEAQGALRWNAWYSDWSRYAIVGRKALDQFGWVGAITALIGLIALARRRPSAALVTFAAYAAFAFFGLSFYVPDPDYSSFLLPAHFVQAAWMAVGISQIAYGIWLMADRLWPIAYRLSLIAITHAKRPSTIGHQPSAIGHRPYALSIVYCAFALIPAAFIWTNLPRVDQSRDWREYRLGQYILSLPLKENAAILADSELIAPLYYLQVAEGVRPDLDIVVLPDEEAYRAELDSRIANGQTVYLGRYLPHLADAYYLHSVGPLAEVKLTPGALPDSAARVDINFGGVIRLRGVALDSPTVAADQALRLTLYWQAIRPPDNYRVVLRLIDSQGAPQLASPATVPVSQMYPTAAWPLDDVVSDFHSFEMDAALDPGEYKLQVGLFAPFAEEGLATDDGGDWLTLAPITVLPPLEEPTIPHPLRARFSNGLWLMGYDAPLSAAPGSPIEVTLYWLMPPEVKGTLTAHLCAGESDCALIQIDAAVRPTARIFETRATLAAPDQTGELPLRIGVVRAIHELPLRCGSVAASRCELPPLRIEGARLSDTAVNFENQIALESLQIETPISSPGGTVIITAQWRGLRPMENDYTVFMHLLGPDGLVHGQVDAWPVQGTLPTSQWPINETIADRFEVRVADDAPPGEYTLEAGWYLLSTLQRLAVLDARDVAIDDKYLLKGLTIK